MIDRLPDGKFQLLQEVCVPLDRPPRLHFEARDVLEEVYLPIQLLLLNLLQAYLKGLVIQRCKVNQFIHSLDRCVASGLFKQSIRAEAFLLMLLVHLLVVQVVHPFVGHVFNGELVRLDLLVELRLVVGVQGLLRVPDAWLLGCRIRQLKRQALSLDQSVTSFLLMEGLHIVGICLRRSLSLREICEVALADWPSTHLLLFILRW